MDLLTSHHSVTHIDLAFDAAGQPTIIANATSLHTDLTSLGTNPTERIISVSLFPNKSACSIHRFRSSLGLFCGIVSVCPRLAEELLCTSESHQKQALAEALSTSSMDPDHSTCFVLEGLIHYLPPSALEILLKDMAHGSRAQRVLVSFIDPEMLERSSFVFLTLVKILRKIPRQHYSPSSLPDRFSKHDFSLSGHWVLMSRSPPSHRRHVSATSGAART